MKKLKIIGIKLNYKAKYLIGIISGILFVCIGDVLHNNTTIDLVGQKNIISYLFWSGVILFIYLIIFALLLLIKKKIYQIFNQATILITLLTINVIMAFRTDQSLTVFTSYLTITIIVYTMIDEYIKNSEKKSEKPLSTNK
jgi:hypothetical protein